MSIKSDYMIAYRRKNREKLRAQAKEWREKNKEKIREANARNYRRYRLDPEFVEKKKEASRSWGKANKRRVQEYRRKNADRIKSLEAARKTKRSIAAKERYHKDPEAYRQRSRDYRRMNPGKSKESKRKWNDLNKAKNQAREAKRHSARRQSAGYVAYNKTNSSAWYSENKARARLNAATFREKNREKVRVYTQNRRAKVRADGAKLSPGLAVRLLGLQKWRCACCRKPLGGGRYHLDHVTPIALGGRNHDRNVQVLCVSCNCSKGAKDPISFMQSRGFLL